MDVFLDRGEYKLILRGDSRATDKVQLSVHPFEELTVGRPVQLVQAKPIDRSLLDLQRVSYWIDIKSRTTVALEAAGRDLADLRIWRDGNWLIDAEPTRGETTPKVGRPLNVLRLSPTLEKGLYLVVAYGGVARKWAEDNQKHPFHLRYGFRELPGAGRRRFTVGPMGYDRYLVKGADFFGIETPTATALSLDVNNYSSGRPFASGGGRTAQITKKTNPPIADLKMYGSEYRMVVVRGEEGQPYVLQHFSSARTRYISSSGTYWVSSVHAGHAADNIDATALVMGSSDSKRPVFHDMVELSSKKPWSRRFNLLASANIYLRVTDSGRYRLNSEGTSLEYRIEPFFTRPPRDYQAPPYQRSGGEGFELGRGFYVLSLRRLQKGIAKVALIKKGFFSFSKDLPKVELPKPATVMGTVRLIGHKGYNYMLSTQPGIDTGMIVRKAPLDLREGLFITQAPGQSVEVPFEVLEAGNLLAVSELGQRLDVSVDGGPWKKSVYLSSGKHKAKVRVRGNKLVPYNLELRPTQLESETPLPKLPDRRLSQLPEFATLTPKQPIYFDLDRRASRSFLVRGDRAALYRLETTGLLATSGNLRTRVVTSLVRKKQNGVGRNFLVQQYLGAGDHQLTVMTEGRSKGHLGVQLVKSQVRKQGWLRPGIPARETLSSDQALMYPFVISKPGVYNIRAQGVERTLRCRLEDEDGWPLLKPGVSADLSYDFPKGRYRLVILPQSVKVRVVTELRPAPKALYYTGHGPHRLPVNRTLEHEWNESKRKTKKSRRKPDVWSFKLPAPVKATLRATSKMHGDLIRLQGKRRIKVAHLPPTGSWSGALPKGRYRLELVHLYEGSGVSYSVSVNTEEMVVGQTRSVRTTAKIPVSIGAPQLVELSSSGKYDVRARLIDAKGRWVLRSDDRPDDWNFLLAGRLEPGRYTLRVSAVDGRRVQTSVSLKARQEKLQKPLALPAKRKIKVGRRMFLYPLELPKKPGMLTVVARSKETIGLVLEAQVDGRYVPVGNASGRPAQLWMYLGEAELSRSYRLRVWSADERSLPLRLSVAVVEPQRATEAQLAQGVQMKALQGASVGALEVALEGPGTFKLSADGRTRWIGAPFEPARAPEHGLLSPQRDRVWLVGAVGLRGRKIRARRLRPSRGLLRMQLQPGRNAQLDLPASSGPVLVQVRSDERAVGVSLHQKGQAFEPRTTSMESKSAVSALLSPKAGVHARLWIAESSPNPTDVGVRIFSFGAPKQGTLRSGSQQGLLARGAAKSLDLGAGNKRLHLALEPYVVAVLSDSAGRELQVIRADRLATVDTPAARLTLLNIGGEQGRYRVDRLESQALARLDASRAYETSFAQAGEVYLSLPTKGRLQVRGATATLIDAQGRVYEGQDIQAQRGGVVRLRHEGGLVIAWLNDGLFGPAPQSAPSATPGKMLALSGRSQAMSISTKKPVMVHLRTTNPVIARWRYGANESVQIFEQGARLDAYLPKGQGIVQLRALGGGLLFGQAELSTTFVGALAEGLGPEIMLSPGRPQSFVFTLKREAEVGLGVRSNDSLVQAKLTDHKGQTLGQGIVQMHRLPAGTYVLSLSLPRSGRPVRARPALVGINPPDTGPPKSVVERFRRLVRRGGR